MIHKTAEVSDKAKIGKNVSVWQLTRIREGVQIGNDCIIGANVYIDHNVKIGSKVKIQNNVLIYWGTEIEDEVFIGPNVCITNDRYPRAATPNGKLKNKSDWKVGQVIIKKGASLGAGSIVVCPNKIGSYAMIGAGSVVTKPVQDYALLLGNPAKSVGFVCKFGHKGEVVATDLKKTKFYCSKCRKNYISKNESISEN